MPFLPCCFFNSIKVEGSIEPSRCRCSSAFGRVTIKWLGWALTLQIVDSQPQICEHSKGAHLISRSVIRITILLSEPRQDRLRRRNSVCGSPHPRKLVLAEICITQ